MHRQRIVSSGFSLNIHLETQFYLIAHMLKTSLGHMASPASYLDIAEYNWIDCSFDGCKEEENILRPSQ